MPAGKLTKYGEGQRIREIHARTHNTLVDAELERRVGTPKPQKTPRGSMSPLVVELAWEEEVDLAPGSAVAIYAPLYEPADRPSTPFEGVRFFARTATTEDIESGHFAITDGPIPAAVGTKYAIGTGHIPAARWAQVDVASTDHTFAEPAENETILASGDAGRFPILWMPAAASGVEWCVVLLAAVGTGSGTPIKRILIDADVAAMSYDYDDETGLLSLTPGTGTGWLLETLVPPAGMDPLKFTVVIDALAEEPGEAIEVINWNHFPIKATAVNPEDTGETPTAILQGYTVCFGKAVSYTVGEGELAETFTVYELFPYDFTGGQFIRQAPTGDPPVYPAADIPEAIYHEPAERGLLWGQGECG